MNFVISDIGSLVREEEGDLAGQNIGNILTADYRLRVLFLENANKVLREEMDRKDVESGKLRYYYSLLAMPTHKEWGL